MRTFSAISQSLIFAGLMTFLNGCQPSLSSATSERLTVVTTTSIIADAVREIGGSRVAVHALMGPGVDPHRYTPSPHDLLRISSADLLFYNGLHLEGKMTEVLEHSSNARRRIVAVTRNLDPVQDLRPVNGDELVYDPHVWFDVRLWMRCVAVIGEELARVDPEHATEYQANTERYLQQLAELDREVRKAAASLPPQRRILVTSHDAFGYFGAAYGFEVRGLQGVSTAAETPLSEVQELARFLGSRAIPAVFAETSVPAKGLQKVLDIVRKEYGLSVRLIGDAQALYSDALGPPGSPGETYIGMVKHNITTIVQALNP